MTAVQYELSRVKIGGCDSWQLTRPNEDGRVSAVSSEPWTDDDGLEWGSQQIKAMCGWRVRWDKKCGNRWKAVRIS